MRWVKVFHLYKGFFRKATTIGFFIKGSARVVEPPRVEYKGFKYKYNVKGDITRMLLVRSNKLEATKTGTLTRFTANAGVNIKKKFDMKSKYLNGPIHVNVRRKKLLTLFKKVLF
jgi:ribosomal protein L14